MKDFFKNILKSLEGYKTKIGMSAGILLQFAYSMHWVNQPSFEALMTIVVLWTGYGYYDSIKRDK